jgi:putative SOS response-associated peptidase YedK
MFREGRCLIPATHFFEWQKLADGKQPFAFALSEQKAFAFAGVYNDSGFVILTTLPNTLMEPVHNRMPCILAKDVEDDWLNPDTSEDQLIAMLKPYPADQMKKWPVSSLVNKPQNNFPEILKPIAAE